MNSSCVGESRTFDEFESDLAISLAKKLVRVWGVLHVHTCTAPAVGMNEKAEWTLEVRKQRVPPQGEKRWGRVMERREDGECSQGAGRDTAVSSERK